MKKKLKHHVMKAECGDTVVLCYAKCPKKDVSTAIQLLEQEIASYIKNRKLPPARDWRITELKKDDLPVWFDYMRTFVPSELLDSDYERKLFVWSHLTTDPRFSTVHPEAGHA